MRVWIHKETFEIVISYQVYAIVDHNYKGMIVGKPEYIGELLECGCHPPKLFSNSVYEEFEFVGYL